MVENYGINTYIWLASYVLSFFDIKLEIEYIIVGEDQTSSIEDCPHDLIIFIDRSALVVIDLTFLPNKHMHDASFFLKSIFFLLALMIPGQLLTHNFASFR